ncbi:MAG: type I methionyl aminopeptidase [Propionibacteriaceae bacterium]|jgi:methionyl aminopeptidase|nr:type I methionyl aminopeptidase [Propionibacteriaceae bacterium]
MGRSHQHIEIIDEAGLKLMRRAGLVVAAGLKAMMAAAVPGATTRQVDAVGAEVLARHGAKSNFLNYAPGYGIPPYPAVSCLSVNNEVVHGIPGDRILQDGDLLSIDFGGIIEGYNGDAARSVIIGQADPRVEALSEATRQSLWAGIGAARIGGTIGDISAAVERSLRLGRYGIVRDFTGHGIGHQMHQEPDIPNYRVGRGPVIRAGMCLAIEPMATLGGYRVAMLDDDWTVVTADSSVAAHWENTITVTEQGLWVLTEEDGGEAELTARGLPFGPLSD